ncbi:hypothetical protein DER45DRAFT_620239 [Fusarium avenaceum]|nr:hypothetical protein DER45DRAFT_620239 [Fusarium avenaceum]
MQLTTILTALSFGIGAHAWAQAANGEWIANNELGWDYNSGYRVWQACTWRESGGLVPLGTGCKYWMNSIGDIHHGVCTQDNMGPGGIRYCR